MRIALRWAGYILAGLLLIILIVAAAVWAASTHKLGGRLEAKPERLVKPSAAELADGPRQLRILGCIACHGEGLRGKLFFDEPRIAQVWAPNLTLIAAEATDQQLAQAMRQGISHDGRSLFIMPSAQYSRLGDGEVAALISAIRVQPKGGSQTPPIKVGPLGRVGVATGKFRTEPELVADYAENLPADLGPRFASGRHIALTACSECHGAGLGGGEPQPGLKAPDLAIAGAYDLPGFARLMRTGRAASGRKLKLMDEISRNDLSHLSDAEIGALHAYLSERARRAP
jgi:cytochrome c553